MISANASAERNHGLDLVRGLCAAAVAGYHHTSWTYGVAIESIGAFGVYAFFILSATTMMLVYAPLFRDGLTRDPVATFYRNRAARIMPLLALVSAVTFVWLLFRGAPVWGNLQKFLLTATGAFSFGTPGLLSGVTGAWSLGIEIVFYAVFPIIVLLSSSASTRSIAWFLLAAFAAQHLTMCILWPFDIRQLWNNYVTPLVFAPYFIMGILIHRLDAGKTCLHLAVSLSALAIAFSFSLFSQADLYRSPAWHLYLSLLIGVAVWAAYRSKLPDGLIGPALFLGEISYALYLTHFLANWLAKLLIGSRPAQSALFVIFAVTLSYMTNEYFEKPMRRYFRRSGSSREGAIIVRTWLSETFMRGSRKVSELKEPRGS